MVGSAFPHHQRRPAKTARSRSPCLPLRPSPLCLDVRPHSCRSILARRSNRSCQPRLHRRRPCHRRNLIRKRSRVVLAKAFDSSCSPSKWQERVRLYGLAFVTRVPIRLACIHTARHTSGNMTGSKSGFPSTARCDRSSSTTSAASPGSSRSLSLRDRPIGKPWT